MIFFLLIFLIFYCALFVCEQPDGLIWQRRLSVAIGIATGLAAMHNIIEGSVLHRNLKSSNIVLAKDFTPKLINCFISLSIFDHKLQKKEDYYTCPEYIRSSQLPFDNMSDIYSLGKILSDLLYGLQIADFSEFESTKVGKMKQHVLLAKMVELNKTDAKEKSKLRLQNRLEEKKVVGDDEVSLFDVDLYDSDIDDDDGDYKKISKSKSGDKNGQGQSGRDVDIFIGNCSSIATYSDSWSSVKVADSFSAIVNKSVSNRATRYTKAITVLLDLQQLVNTKYEQTEEEDDLVDKYNSRIQSLRDEEGSSDSGSSESDTSDKVIVLLFYINI